MRYSVVVPVFADISAMPELLARLFGMADARADEVELVLVDDGSPPPVREQLLQLLRAWHDRRIVLVRLAHNHGQQAATLCGLLHCTSELLVTMDADLQHAPEDIPLLLQALVQGGCDLVYGSGSSGHGWLRRVLSATYRSMAALVGSAFFHASSFRALHRRVLLQLQARIRHRTLSIDDCLRTVLDRAGHVRVTHRPRTRGRSAYGLVELLMLVARHGYHSPMLEPVLRRLALVTGVLVLFNQVPASPPVPSWLAVAVLVAALLLLAFARRVTHRRTALALPEQFAVQEVIIGMPAAARPSAG